MNTDFNNPANDDNVAGADNHGQHHAGNEGPGHNDQEEVHADGMETAVLDLEQYQPDHNLAECLKDSEDAVAALEEYAAQLSLAAAMVRNLISLVDWHFVSIETDGHRILVTAPGNVIFEMRDRALLERDEGEEDEEETTSPTLALREALIRARAKAEETTSPTSALRDARSVRVPKRRRRSRSFRRLLRL